MAIMDTMTANVSLLTATCPPRRRKANYEPYRDAMKRYKHHGWNSILYGHCCIKWITPGYYREANPGSWWPADMIDSGPVIWFSSPEGIKRVH